MLLKQGVLTGFPKPEYREEHLSDPVRFGLTRVQWGRSWKWQGTVVLRVWAQVCRPAPEPACENPAQARGPSEPSLPKAALRAASSVTSPGREDAGVGLGGTMCVPDSLQWGIAVLPEKRRFQQVRSSSGAGPCAGWRVSVQLPRQAEPPLPLVFTDLSLNRSTSWKHSYLSKINLLP